MNVHAPHLQADAGEIERFVGALFPYASAGCRVSLRAFYDDRDEVFGIRDLVLNGEGLAPLVTEAAECATQAAAEARPVVFCPPIAAFGEGRGATEADLAEGLALSVELDAGPTAARAALEHLLGPATVVVASGGEWADPETGEIEPKLHLHWRLTEPTRVPDEHAKLKQARKLATALTGGDCSNVPTVHPIRWPGSWHRKGAPRLARIVALNERAELELDEALGLLQEAAAARGLPERSVGPAAAPAARGAFFIDVGPPIEGRSVEDSTADLVRKIVTGESYHPALVPLSARLIGAGMHSGAVATHLRDLMKAVPAHARDARWHARYAAIPGIAESAQVKFGKPDTCDAARTSTFRSVASLHGMPVPQRKWLVPGLIPANTVTLLSGDGGTGKSLLVKQLLASSSLGRSWIGREVTPGRTLYVSAEDDGDELHRRFADIAAAEGATLAGLGLLTYRSLAGEDALLAALHRQTDALVPTPLLAEIDEQIGDERPVAVGLDTLADFHPADENQRAKARQFIGLMRGLAIRHSTSVILLAHPSLTGLNTGTGTSGSTGWSNSVRSRLYLERIYNEDRIETDPDARILSCKKNNYDRVGAEIRLRWVNGVFVAQQEAGDTWLDAMAATSKAERVFLKLLREFAECGRYVSSQPGPTYAPSQFASHPAAEGVTKRVLKSAMDSLFAAKRIKVATHGTGAKARSHIVEVAGA